MQIVLTNLRNASVCVCECMYDAYKYICYYNIYISIFIYGVCLLLFLRFYQRANEAKRNVSKSGQAGLPGCLVALLPCCHVLPASQARVYKYNYACCSIVLKGIHTTHTTPHTQCVSCGEWVVQWAQAAESSSQYISTNLCVLITVQGVSNELYKYIK